MDSVLTTAYTLSFSIWFTDIYSLLTTDNTLPKPFSESPSGEDGVPVTGSVGMCNRCQHVTSSTCVTIWYSVIT